MKKIDSTEESLQANNNRAIAPLSEEAIAAYEQRRTAFLELADRFQKSGDPTETARLREELARMTFGG
jgi:hypothetical protein